MATVNTGDSRLSSILDERNQLANEIQSNYDKQSGLANQKYNELIQASKDYGEKQAEIQQQKTNQAIEEIEQNKEKTNRDYLKEQRGAYSDYAKQTNEYGVNAEQMASAGLTGTGYQESSKVSMYNAYQNRIAVARQSYNDAITQYNNQINEARIANSSALAEIAYNALQTQLQLSIENMQYENQLLQTLAQQKLNISTSYNQLWQSMYNTLLDESQFNENLAMQKQQFNEQMAYQRERDRVEDNQWEKQYQLSLASLRQSSSKSSSSSKKSSSKKSSSKKTSNSSNSGNLVVNDTSTTQEQSGPTPQEIINKMQIVDEPGVTSTIKDGISGKTFKNIESLMSYHGYIATKESQWKLA